MGQPDGPGAGDIRPRNFRQGGVTMKSIGMWSVLGLLTAASALQAQRAMNATEKSAAQTTVPTHADKEVRRGKLLATFGGCHDCHTPKVMTPNGPQPDTSRLLSGYPS